MQENNRRTFLKTVGIAMGAAGTTSTTAVSQETSESNPQQETPGSGASGWSTLRGNPLRAGVVDASGPDPYPMTEWKMDLDGMLSNSEPIITDQAVYLPVTTDNSPSGNEGYFGKYDVQSGDELWKQTDLPAPKTPTVGSERIYVPTKVTEATESGESGLYALDRQDGAIVWSRDEVSKWAAPALVNGVVYTANDDGAVALNRSSGTTEWKTDGVGGIAKGYDDQVSVAEETVYFSDGTALDAEDGSILWEVSSDDPVIGKQAVRSGFVFFLRNRNQNGSIEVVLEARSAQTGDLEWTYYSEDNMWGGEHAVSDNCVIITEAFGEGSDIVGLDIATGAEKWRTRLQGDFISSVCGDETSIFVGGRFLPENSAEEQQAFIAAIERATGDTRWMYLLDNSGLETSPENPPAAGTPAVADGRVCAATYPAGSTLDYEYTLYSNFFILGGSETPPDDGQMVSIDEKSDDDTSRQLKARIDPTADRDLSDLDPGETVRLNGHSSMGDDLTYEWDTDGDGKYETASPSTEVTAPKCGTMKVILEVTDSDGETDMASVTISSK